MLGFWLQNRRDADLESLGDVFLAHIGGPGGRFHDAGLPLRNLLLSCHNREVYRQKQGCMIMAT